MVFDSRIGSVTLGLMKPLKLTPAVGGWLHADWGDGKAWVRFATDSRQRLTRIAEIHLADPTPTKLRRVPLNRIHSAATMRGAGLVNLLLALGLNGEPPPGMLSSTPPRDQQMALENRFKLKRPSGKNLGDDFYRDVAYAYQSAMAFGLNPRQAIVGDTGRADATVAAWVMEARRRGHLKKAQLGKRSAQPIPIKGT